MSIQGCRSSVAQTQTQEEACRAEAAAPTESRGFSGDHPIKVNLQATRPLKANGSKASFTLKTGQRKNPSELSFIFTVIALRTRVCPSVLFKWKTLFKALAKTQGG